MQLGNKDENIIAVVPAYNERRHLALVVQEVIPYVDHIVVVDDGSSDGGAETLQLHDKISLLKHRINLGKGAALKTGCQAAIVLNASIIVCIDADGQHKAEDIPNMLAQFEHNSVDIVFGVRQIRSNMPIIKLFGNKFLSYMTLLLFGIKIADTQSGFRIFRSKIYHKIIWDSSRYSVETEMVANVAKHHISFACVPIQTIYHDQYKGTSLIDGIRIFINMLMWKIL